MQLIRARAMQVLDLDEPWEGGASAIAACDVCIVGTDRRDPRLPVNCLGQVYAFSYLRAAASLGIQSPIFSTKSRMLAVRGTKISGLCNR
jgi:hypothetical protein